MSVFVREVFQADLAAAGAVVVPETPLGEAQFDGTFTDIALIPEAALVAADATARTLTIFNRGQAGAGTTVVATLVTNLAGGNWAANDEKAFTLSATPANLQFVTGDTFECVESVAGAGTARPTAQITGRGTSRALP